MDNRNRVARLRVGSALPHDTAPALTVILGDHLGSSSLVIDGAGGWINREEFSPYGETSLGSFAHKRYRFTGKERDEESGCYYHGARYYAPWIARWTAPDPIGLGNGIHPYVYVSGNPLRLVDPTGTQDTTSSTAEDEKERACIDITARQESEQSELEEREQASIDMDKRAAPLLHGALVKTYKTDIDIEKKVNEDLQIWFYGRPGKMPVKLVDPPKEEPDAPLPMCGGSACGEYLGAPGKAVINIIAPETLLIDMGSAAQRRQYGDVALAGVGFLPGGGLWQLRSMGTGLAGVSRLPGILQQSEIWAAQKAISEGASIGLKVEVGVASEAEMLAARRYLEVLEQTRDFGKAGQALHEALGAGGKGADQVLGRVIEFKSRNPWGLVTASEMERAMKQAMGYWLESGAGAAPMVKYFELGSGNMYHITIGAF